MPDQTAPDEGLVDEARPESAPTTAAAAAESGQSVRRPRRLRSLLIGTGIAAVLAGLLFVVLRPSAPVASGTSGNSNVGVITVGSKAPDFTLPNLQSGPPGPVLPPVHLDALGVDVHRPVILNFFASYCIPCQQETPLIASTATSLAAQGSPVQFVGVDVSDPTADGQAFAKQAKITYPVAADRTLAVTSVLYALNSQPDTFFINAQGRVVGHQLGAVSKTELNHWVAVLSH